MDAQLIRSQRGDLQFKHCSQDVDSIKIKPLKDQVEIAYDGKIFLFNTQNQLLAVKTPKVNMEIKHSAGRIVGLKVNGIDLKVKTIDTGKRIAEIQAPLGSMQFHYQRGLLTKIQANSENSMRFEYDAFDNMTFIEKKSHAVNRALASISYSSKDRVSEVRSPNTCRSSYSYDEQKNGANVVLFSKVQRHCLGFSDPSFTKVLSSQFKLSKGNHLELVAVKETYL